MGEDLGKPEHAFGLGAERWERVVISGGRGSGNALTWACLW